MEASTANPTRGRATPLLPHTEEDLAWLEQRLGQGATDILSRGYGNCRVRATALGFKSEPTPFAAKAEAPAALTHRDVVFAEAAGPRARKTAIYARDALGPGARIDGPAIVLEKTSTTVAPPGWRGEIDAYGNLLLRG